MGSRKNAAPNREVGPYVTAHKCVKHNQWKRKVRNHPELGKVCELCRLELDKIQQQNELTGGSNKPPVKIGKL